MGFGHRDKRNGWKKLAVFCAPEIKTVAGRATSQQKKFIRAVQDAGGFATIARSEEQAIRDFNGWLRFPGVGPSVTESSKDSTL
jgi:hypothetical protein